MRMKKPILLLLGAIFCLFIGTLAFAVTLPSSGIGGVATQVKSSLSGIALLITAGAYVTGMGFGVAAIAKFKAHKDNPTQIPLSTPVVLLFVAAALIFIPSVFKTVGGTLYGASGTYAGTSGITKI